MIALHASGAVSSRYLAAYVLVWIGYFGLLALVPVEYGRLEQPVALWGLVAWVLLSAAVALVMHVIGGRWIAGRRMPLAWLARPLEGRDLARLINLALGFSFFGFAALLYDRLVVQGIDFSQGIAVARELWRQAGEERDGISSIFSVLGYLFGFSFVVATTLAHLHWESLSRKLRRRVLLSAFVLVLANSLLTGGRSIVLVQLTCVAGTGILRSFLGQPMLPGKGARIWLLVVLGLLLSVGYSLYVFSARADANSSLPERYAQGMLRYLGGEPSNAFYRLGDLPAPIATTAQFATVAGAYLTHSYGTFETVLSMPSTPGRVSFGLVREIFAKLGLVTPNQDEWALSGRFLSLPGTLWYDFGWPGFFSGALVMGIALGSVPLLLSIRGGGGIAVCAAVLVLVTALLSPLLLAIDMLIVPFLILGFGVIDVLHRCWAGSTSWLALGRFVRRVPVEGLV